MSTRKERVAELSKTANAQSITIKAFRLITTNTMVNKDKQFTNVANEDVAKYIDEGYFRKITHKLEIISDNIDAKLIVPVKHLLDILVEEDKYLDLYLEFSNNPKLIQKYLRNVKGVIYSHDYVAGEYYYDVISNTYAENINAYSTDGTAHTLIDLIIDDKQLNEIVSKLDTI